ncbi:MAG TPA: dTDP-4-dehydrorhamnose reductase [Candidatus Rifleibacterium sp.]|nr:dTDP-4-dehydrorhamnose reductase [Candidatus Rifleibacterium sp.]
MKRVIITGANGQLGFELRRTAPENSVLLALTRSELDITSRDSVFACIAREQPGVIINCAAYTAVDRAESEIEKAHAVNQIGPRYLAEAARQHNALLVHISTDFVFDGSQGRPYSIEDRPNPLSVYGKSKLAGENEVVNSGAEAFIVRTAWLYSSHGNNFVKTMLRLMKERESIGVVADQIGTPTWANSLAQVIWQLIDRNARGLFHWSDAGVASWYDFAVAIQEEAHALGLLQKQIPIKAIATTDYPLPATRPGFSVLDKTATCRLIGHQPDHWRTNLRQMLKELTGPLGP